jgi:hypothetical protein
MKPAPDDPQPFDPIGRLALGKPPKLRIDRLGKRYCVLGGTGHHDATAAGLVADLRALATQRGHDPATARFVDELRAASDEFARTWDQHDVYRMQPGFEVLHHPQVGRLALQCAVLHGRAPGQRLFLFRAAAGTPTGGRLAALAGLSQTDVTGSS